MSKNNIIISSLIVIILIMAYFLYQKPGTQIVANQEQIYKDSLSLLHTQIGISEKQKVKIQNSYDSISRLEQSIIYRTHEKINFILTTATPNQLDSIITAGFKRKLRYH